MIKFFLLWCIVPFVVSAAPFQVVYMGCFQGGAPAFERTFDALLREKISAEKEIVALDQAVAQRYAERINFGGYTTVSQSLIEKLRSMCTDSTVFIWGRIHKYSIQKESSGWFNAQLTGNMAITYNFYSLNDPLSAYTTALACSVSVQKGSIFTYPVDRFSPVSIHDRQSVVATLQEEAVLRSAELILKVVKREYMHSKSRLDTSIAQYKAPSFSDVFDVPSVEARTNDQAPVDYNQIPEVNATKTDTISGGSR